MFGTLRAHTCSLGGDDRADYRRLYCGTCRGLGEYGLAPRALLSNDAVLLAAVADGLLPEGGGHGTARCPANPLVHRDVLVPESRATQLAAAAQLWLADEWVADKQADGSWAGALRPLTRSRGSEARSRLEGLGIDVPDVLDDVVEVQGVTEVLDAAEPTAVVLEALCGGIDPELPAVPLRRLGRALGRIVYTIDALEDLFGDLDSGDFNPCLDRRGQLDLARRDAVIDLLRTELAGLPALIDVLPWKRHRSVVEHVLCQELPKRRRRPSTPPRPSPHPLPGTSRCGPGWSASGGV